MASLVDLVGLPSLPPLPFLPPSVCLFHLANTLSPFVFLMIVEMYKMTYWRAVFRYPVSL